MLPQLVVTGATQTSSAEAHHESAQIMDSSPPAPVSSPSIFTPNPATIALSSETQTDLVAAQEAVSSFTCLASLKARLYEETERAGMDVVAVLDRSGELTPYIPLVVPGDLKIDHLTVFYFTCG